MKVSAISNISADDTCQRKNMFIRYSNSFMSMPENVNPVNKAFETRVQKTENKNTKMGIETLEHFTIFPKEVVEGKTIITA